MADTALPVDIIPNDEAILAPALESKQDEVPIANEPSSIPNARTPPQTALISEDDNHEDELLADCKETLPEPYKTSSMVSIEQDTEIMASIWLHIPLPPSPPGSPVLSADMLVEIDSELAEIDVNEKEASELNTNDQADLVVNKEVIVERSVITTESHLSGVVITEEILVKEIVEVNNKSVEVNVNESEESELVTKVQIELMANDKITEAIVVNEIVEVNNDSAEVDIEEKEELELNINSQEDLMLNEEAIVESSTTIVETHFKEVTAEEITIEEVTAEEIVEVNNESAEITISEKEKSELVTNAQVNLIANDKIIEEAIVVNEIVKVNNDSAEVDIEEKEELELNTNVQAVSIVNEEVAGEKSVTTAEEMVIIDSESIEVAVSEEEALELDIDNQTDLTVEKSVTAIETHLSEGIIIEEIEANSRSIEVNVSEKEETGLNTDSTVTLMVNDEMTTEESTTTVEIHLSEAATEEDLLKIMDSASQIAISVQESLSTETIVTDTSISLAMSRSEGASGRLMVPGGLSAFGQVSSTSGPSSPGISIFSHTSDEGGRSYSEDRFSLPGRSISNRRPTAAKRVNPWEARVALWKPRPLPLFILARVAHFAADATAVSLALTCQGLHQKVSRDNYRWQQSYVMHFPLTNEEIDWLRWCKARMLLSRQRSFFSRGKLDTKAYHQMGNDWYCLYQQRRQLEVNWCQGQNNSRTIQLPILDMDSFGPSSDLATGIASELLDNLTPTSPLDKKPLEEPEMSVEVLLSNIWGFIIRVSRTRAKSSTTAVNSSFNAHTTGDDWSDSDMDYSLSENSRIPSTKRRKPEFASTDAMPSFLDSTRFTDDDTGDADVESDWDDQQSHAFSRRNTSMHGAPRRTLLAQAAARARHQFHSTFATSASISHDILEEGVVTPDKFYYVSTLSLGYRSAYVPIELLIDVDSPISIDQVLMDDQFVAITYHPSVKSRKLSATLEGLNSLMNTSNNSADSQPMTCVWSIATLIANNNNNHVTLPYVSVQELRDGWLLATRHRSMDMDAAKRVVYDLCEPLNIGFRHYPLSGISQACHLERFETSFLASQTQDEPRQRRICVFKCDMVNGSLKYEYVEITARPFNICHNETVSSYEQVDLLKQESSNAVYASIHKDNITLDHSSDTQSIVESITADIAQLDQHQLAGLDFNEVKSNDETTTVDDNIINSIANLPTPFYGLPEPDADITIASSIDIDIPRSTATPKPCQTAITIDASVVNNPTRVLREGEHSLKRAPAWLTGDMLCTQTIGMGRVLIHPIYTDPDQPTWLCTINLVGRGQLLWECTRTGIIDIRAISASDLIALHEDDGWALTGAHTGRDIAYAYTPQFSRGDGLSYPPEPIIGRLHWGEAVHPVANRDKEKNQETTSHGHLEHGIEYELIDGINGHRRGPFPLRPAANRRFWTSAAHVVVWEMRAPEFLFLLDFAH
ncbi:hypothetical protein BDF19DRAFT_467072 [Syncephalis fuscata]|nr:hypothetical protein BDF19DRAFT_467072 [Syncephalis fuscata]